MRLYHGGSVVVQNPQPVSPEKNRPLDFGSGFYTTTSDQWKMPEITQKNFRALLPGKIASAVMIASSRFGRDCFDVAKQFYDSPIYAELEREASKYWWMSPDQIEQGYERVML